MSLSIVPAIVLAVMFFVAGAGEDGALHKKPASSRSSFYFGKKKVTKYPRPSLEQNISVLEKDKHLKKVQKNDRHGTQDYNTIYSYITNKFKRVDKKDAEEISEKLVNYGEKYNVDPKFAAAIIARESSFKKEAESKTGAKGLGQIKDFNHKALNIEDPFSIDDNVDGTVHYIKKMIKKWNESPQKEKPSSQDLPSDEENVKLALASYYKGYTAVKEEGVDTQTKKYVDDIVDYYNDIISFEGKKQ